MTDAVEMEIRVCGIRRDAGGEVEEIVCEALGTYCRRGDTHYLRYEDRDLIEGESISTILKCTRDEAVILRRGGYAQELRFRRGERTENVYRAPGGGIRIAFQTDALDLRRSADGGALHLSYRSFLEGAEAGRHELTAVWAQRRVP